MSTNLELIRKEKPTQGPKPPARPPAPGGVRVPGDSRAPNGMVCPGSGRPRRALAAEVPAGDAVQETVLENPIQKVLKRPSELGGRSIFLTIVEGAGKGTSYNITGLATYTIGRFDCDIVLNDDKVSRKHASVSVVRADKYTVTDLASRNGTFVNGARMTGQDLNHNDLIRVGDTTLRFTVFQGPVPVSR